MRIRKLEILYEDVHILVCRKPAGVATQSARAGQQDMVSLIKNERAKKKEEPYVGLIHRLDQPVEGVMVFAKTKQAAAKLSKQVSDRGIDKYYLAVAEGFMEEEGVLEHYLVKDSKTNLSRVASGPEEKDAKKAKLSYQLLSYDKVKNHSLIKIKLNTGRHHQIRVQMSCIGHPLVGDQKYNQNATGGNVALCSHQIGFIHPVTGKQMEYEILPKNPHFDGFEILCTLDN